MIVDFYHLVSAPLEKVLPKICEKLLAQDQRLVIVAEPRLLDAIDEQLWSYAPNSFVPHARAGTGSEQSQPVLLAEDVTAPNGARNVAIADGRWREEALGMDRIFFFFDDGQLSAARPAWTGLKDRDDVERRYWKQDSDGKWVQGP